MPDTTVAGWSWTWVGRTGALVNKVTGNRKHLLPYASPAANSRARHATHRPAVEDHPSCGSYDCRGGVFVPPSFGATSCLPTPLYGYDGLSQTECNDVLIDGALLPCWGRLKEVDGLLTRSIAPHPIPQWVTTILRDAAALTSLEVGRERFRLPLHDSPRPSLSPRRWSSAPRVRPCSRSRCPRHACVSCPTATTRAVRSCVGLTRRWERRHAAACTVLDV